VTGSSKWKTDVNDVKPEDAESLIKRLGLQPHPEGGFFRETYRAEMKVTRPESSGDSDSVRSAGTAILYLLAGDQVSHLHRIRSDEIWHFYEGSALAIDMIDPFGGYRRKTIGAAFQYQVVVPAGTWFGASLLASRGYALVGCTVAPGFEFADFELADRVELLKAYSRHRAIIERLTREAA